MGLVQPRPDLTDPALLVLEDGRCFTGRPYGAVGSTFGEAVFSTAMTGYQETLTDPSYHRQVVVMTAPHVGNTGMNDEDAESDRIWVSGYVVRDPSPHPSSWRARRDLESDLQAQGVIGIAEVDTRAVTRHLRERGAMRAGIFSGAEAVRSIPDLVDRVRASPAMAGADLVADVSTTLPYVVPAVGSTRFRVAALDLGIKAATPQHMAERGIEVHVLPVTTTADEILAEEYDGVFLSNGPGDPATADRLVDVVRRVLGARRPLFGICLGHQILGRALGLPTYKLGYGHRGVNLPVQDLATLRVSITAHNHGFAVEAPIGVPFDTDVGRARTSHACLNDGVVEGIECLEAPAFSVQFHPEAAAGPHDAAGLFDRFAHLMASARDGGR